MHETERDPPSPRVVDLTVRIGGSLEGAPQSIDQGGEERFRALIEAAPDAVVVIDPAGRIVLVNEQTEALFRYPREELVGQPVELLLPERFRAAHVGHRRSYLADPHRRPMGGLVLAGRRRDGSEFPVDISLGSMEADAEGTLGMAFIRDITERHTAEAALAAVHAELADRAAQLERRNAEMVLVSDMGNLLQTCRRAEEAYDIIGRFARRLFASEAGSIFVRKPGNLLVAVASWGRADSGKTVFGPEDCWALRRGLAQIGGRSELHPRCAHVGAFDGDYLCVPMMARSRSMGVIHLRRDAPPTGFAAAVPRWDSTLSVAMAMTEHIALALANFQLRETLRRQSIRDPLTDLFNRRFLDEYLDRELRRAARSGSPLAVVMLDIDSFKEFNDTFGHAVGDGVLVGLGQLLRTTLRGGDVACRYGGEEFTMVLPDCPLDAARRRTEELLDLVRRLTAPGADRPITASAGVAAFPDHGLTIEALLHAADGALYKAKRRGRDRAEVAAPGDAYDGGGDTGGEATL